MNLINKTALRARFKAYRMSLNDEDYVGRSHRIVTRLAEMHQLEHAGTIHVYWPHLSAREIDLRPLISYLRALGKTIVLPVVDFKASDPRLTHHVFSSERELKPNKWGILEPLNTQQACVDDIDVAIVPALGLDRQGYRIGYGGGYYDVFLSSTGASIVCPIFGACIIENLPIEEHDVPVNVTVTEYESITHNR